MSRFIRPLLVLLFCLIVLASCGNGAASSTTPTPTVPPARPTTVPTPTPTPKPTPIPSRVPVSSGPAVIGAPIGPFITKYGQPNKHSDTGQGTYYFSIYNQAAQMDDLTVQLAGSRSLDIIYNAPTDQGWNLLSEAQAACHPFLPSDAVYKRSIQQTDSSGVPVRQEVYVSPSLGTEFPASSFTNENGNAATPGTIGVLFTDESTTDAHIADCVVQVGLQQK